MAMIPEAITGSFWMREASIVDEVLLPEVTPRMTCTEGGRARKSSHLERRRRTCSLFCSGYSFPSTRKITRKRRGFS